jgi:hypothetical protein
VTNPSKANPPTRDALLTRWRDARRRRESAEPGSKQHIEASEEVAAIEVEIARVERAANPPLA